jgi:hypothetical protein
LTQRNLIGNIKFYYKFNKIQKNPLTIKNGMDIALKL